MIQTRPYIYQFLAIWTLPLFTLCVAECKRLTFKLSEGMDCPTVIQIVECYVFGLFSVLVVSKPYPPWPWQHTSGQTYYCNKEHWGLKEKSLSGSSRQIWCKNSHYFTKKGGKWRIDNVWSRNTPVFQIASLNHKTFSYFSASWLLNEGKNVALWGNLD